MKNKAYLLIGFLTLIIAVLSYKLINKTPTLYDCLKLGSDLARVTCIEHYNIKI